jgi:trans-2,3-dihydro-3-hydroxyanthranilate isomerase
MHLDFHTLDVFTDRVFGGNPLGVVPDASGLDDGTMQAVARELNLSETVFLLPPETEGGTRRVRIFTPATEVPFAGHPTVGTAHLLASEGVIRPEGGPGRIVLEEEVGPVPVEVEWDGDRPGLCTLTTAVPPESREVRWGRDRLAEMLSLPEGAVGAEGLDPAMVSCGLPYVLVPVRDLEAARAARLDLTVWDQLTAGAWSRMIYIVTTETEGDGADLHVRMFAPSAGVPEDPATGSAAAALGAYLGARAGLDGVHAWTVEQGLEMGRPSTLHVEARVREGAVERVRVGGRCVPVIRGTMELTR